MKSAFVALLMMFILHGLSATEDVLHNDCTLVYYDAGSGDMYERAVNALEGGITYEWNQKFAFTAYKILYEDSREFMSNYPAKYTFHGYGISAGPVFRRGRVKLIPSLGMEFGELRTGSNLLYHDQGFWHYYYWETDSFEDLSNFHVSLLVRYKLLSFVTLRAKFGANLGKSPAVPHASLGIGIGRV